MDWISLVSARLASTPHERDLLRADPPAGRPTEIDGRLTRDLPIARLEAEILDAPEKSAKPFGATFR
jgi:hypothetical protein